MLGERHARAQVGQTEAMDPGTMPGAVQPYSAWRDPVAWIIAACVFGAYFTISLFRLIQLSPASWDLGIYTEYVKDLADLRAPIVDVRGPGFNLLGDHFQVAVAVLAPFFRLFPTPATLLFFQALFAAVSVFPVVAAGRALVSRSAGLLVGFGYGFSWGLQQMIDFDFHEIALAVPLLAFCLSALVRGRVRAAILWAMPLVFVKEDQGFTVAAIGAYLLIAAVWDDTVSEDTAPEGTASEDRVSEDRVSEDRVSEDTASEDTASEDTALESEAVPPERRRTALWGGTFLFAWGLLWSVFAIAVIIPHFNPQHVYYYWADGGVVGDGKPFSVTALLTQSLQGWPVKLGTVVMLLLPVAFTALGSPVALIALPALALRFISTNSAYWGTDWHYNATIMPILFIAAIHAIARWRNPAPGLRSVHPVVRTLAGRWYTVRDGLARHGAPMMAIVAVALAFQFPLSGLWHASTYRINPHVAADNAAMAVVPNGATVQTTLDFLAPLAARTDTFWIGNQGNPLTQYIVFDGLNSGYTPAPSNVPAFIHQLYPNAGYVQIYSRNDVYVFRRP